MRLLMLLVVLSMVSAPSVAQEWQLIGSAALQTETVSSAVLRELYLGKKRQLPSGETVVVFDSNDQGLREQFAKRVLGMSAIQLRAYWAKRVFTGKGRPPKQLSSQDLAARLADSDVAIGYIESHHTVPDSTIRLTVIDD